MNNITSLKCKIEIGNNLKSNVINEVYIALTVFKSV